MAVGEQVVPGVRVARGPIGIVVGTISFQTEDRADDRDALVPILLPKAHRGILVGRVGKIDAVVYPAVVSKLTGRVHLSGFAEQDRLGRRVLGRKGIAGTSQRGCPPPATLHYGG